MDCIVNGGVGMGLREAGIEVGELGVGEKFFKGEETAAVDW